MDLHSDIYNAFFPHMGDRLKSMVFVDGENLAARYAEQRGERPDAADVHYRAGVYVWSDSLAQLTNLFFVKRTYFYTGMQGSEEDLTNATESLKNLRVSAPRVFKKMRGARSKRVDISLATDMLSHAHRRNINIAVLISGDGDYVPLVEAVQREGVQVFLWALPSGLSPALRAACDLYADLTPVLFGLADKPLSTSSTSPS